MMSGIRVAWIIVAISVVAACLFAPLNAAHILAMLLHAWCISVFSQMGSREHMSGTLKCIAVLPNGRTRQIMFSWSAGIIIAFAAVLPIFIRQVLSGIPLGALSCVAASIFVPSLALFLGEWTQSRRAFEIVFVILTYLNLNMVPEGMYLEVRPERLSLAQLLAFLLVGLILGGLAVFKRLSLTSIA